jgi:chemotaxis protein MotB
LRLKKTDNEENRISTDRYLITYADLITLLLGLFVIMYVVSQVDESKYKKVSEAFSDYFKSTKEQVLQGSGGVLKGHKQGLPEPIMPNPSNKTLEKIQTEAETAFQEYISKGTLSIKKKNDEVILTLSEKLMFPSGKADMQLAAYPVLDTVAAILTGIPFQLSIDGHTDDAPIRTYRFESNWHLSIARAMSVGYYLIQRGITEHNLMIRGFGSQRPVSDNTTEEGRAKNRRVDITISRMSHDVPITEGYNKPDSTGK